MPRHPQKRRPPERESPAPTPRARLAPTALAIAALCAAAAGIWWVQTRQDAPMLLSTPAQNVLLITIDTLRADALGSYGGRAATPNLDRLALDGMRFTFAHAHAVVTLPSHASILTGRYPFDHGVRDNAGFRLDDKAETLAEAARASGFATGAFVGAFPLDRQFGLAQGFDVYGDLGGRDVAPSDFAFSERPASEVVADARAWIAQQQKPWLAWVHVFDPHSPYAPPAPFAQQYAGDLYAGEVAFTDQALAPLLDMARAGARPTTVIVTADHGEGLGEHGETTHGVFAYESTLRVPLIVAQVGAGTASKRRPVVSDVPVRHVDILPTIAGLTGIAAPANLPGRSLVTAVDGEREERTSYFEAMTATLKRGWAPLRGVLAGRDKYIDLPLEEAYDLASDPREEKNIAAGQPDRVRVLAAQLKGFNAALPGNQADENAEVRARLQSLGYLSGSSPRKALYTEDDDPKRLIDVDRLMMEGIELHRAGRSREAADAYRRVLVRRPDMSLAYRRLAYIQWEAGATGDAIGTLRDALAKTGRDLDIEIRLGTYLAETGAAAEAVPMLERTVKAAPGNVEAANGLGIAYARASRPGDALRTFERVLATDPRNAFALENLGTVQLQRGDLRAAQDAFARAVTTAPTSSRAHAGLGVIASQQQRNDEAIVHWRRAVELDPRNFDALFNLTSALIRAGRVADARPYASQFVRTAPGAFYARDIERFRGWLETR
ncbi:MAG TPA: sulfatase-like hydrolase/transferase [Vicinamibacterales bacterium]|nr:sulfatase-like hydrolase/transferase [Vicinamibacterales bacterium]